ncbi:MAG: histidine phosphatase family protein [Thiothrix sp.]|nr:MAG: histidine phosphatase family protein [Thiothrix sp.]
MKITLLRHGKPVIPIIKKISASEFLNWVKKYDASGLCATSKPPKQAINCAKNSEAIVCSELPRSIESAEALNSKAIILSSSLFNEAGMPSANWHTLKVSPKIWAPIFRLFWLFGYSNNSESFQEAKSRAKEAVIKLTEIAHEQESVVFVGHAIFNRILANELRHSGWSGPKNPGTKHWSFGVYALNK